MKWLERVSTYYILKKHAIPDHAWFQVTKKLPLLGFLNSSEKTQLRVLTTLFIYKKTFIGTYDLSITMEMKIIIAAQACLQILKLGLNSFDGWQEIIIYPTAFKVRKEVGDEAGIVHIQNHALTGEAWIRGPVVLSWDDVERDSFNVRAGHHIVIHEFAHKLDMLNGRANGMPPLHPDMPIQAWTESLSTAYQHLIKRLEHHHNEINAYAATNPAEFFAVMSEYFFTSPATLENYYPDVFQQLKRYFRLTPQRSGH